MTRSPRNNRQDVILRTFLSRFTFHGAAWDSKRGKCKTFGLLPLLTATGSIRLIVRVSLNSRNCWLSDLRTILEKVGTDRWINTELPKIALEYFRRIPEKANERFVSALRSHSREGAYAGTFVSAVLAILSQIPRTDGLLAAAIDLSDPQRTLFFCQAS